jgi:hypothetical protein
MAIPISFHYSSKPSSFDCFRILNAFFACFGERIAFLLANTPRL